MFRQTSRGHLQRTVKKVLRPPGQVVPLSSGGDTLGGNANFRNNKQDGGRKHQSPSSHEIADQSFADCSHNLDPIHFSNESIDSPIKDNVPPIEDKVIEAYSHARSRITSEARASTNDGPTRKVLPNAYEASQSDVLLFDITNDFGRYKHYAPIKVYSDLCCVQDRDFSFPANLLGSQMHIPSWDYELSYENDVNLRDYLHFGIHNGFLIVDQDCNVPSYECPNYSSVCSGKAFEFVNDVILKELSNGKYVTSESKPHCVHSLGAVPKKGTNKWRPITDCKRPLGNSINTFMTSTFHKFCYTTVDNIIDMLRPGMFMASIDISAAYRSILVHPSQWKYQGISWSVNGEPTYLLDTHLCFGLRCAPYIFTQVSNFIIRCLKRRGFSNCTAYLDDFLVTGETEQQCFLAQQNLIEILRSLGFFIAWDKCISPTQQLTYLGVTFDTTDMSVKIPPDKLSKLHEELNFFSEKKRATLKQIQRLCGVLAHCSKVVKGGRTFSHRIIELLKGWPPNTKRIRLSDQCKYDILWWKNFADIFNGKNLMIAYNFGQGPHFTTDACFAGYGLWTERDWQAGFFDSPSTPDISSLNSDHTHWVNIHLQDVDSSSNINVLELIPIWLSLIRWGHTWRDLHAVCFTDNTSVMCMVNKGFSVNKKCMVLLRDIFWRCAINNIHLTARHVPGNVNLIADSLSRVKFTQDLSILDHFLLCCSNQGFSCRHGQFGQQGGTDRKLSMGGFDPEDAQLPMVEVY